jgi:hypothetical protein
VKNMQESTLSATNQTINYTVILEEDHDDLIMPIPDHVLKHLGWKEGDTLEWHIEDHSIILRKSLTFDP